MPFVLFETKDHIARITLNRPDAMNAMNTPLYGELQQAFTEVKDNDDIRVAILTGTGERAFSAGADLKEMAERVAQGKPPMASLPFYRDMELWKPIIAAINGYAMGGGCELALCCDIRIAAEHAQFGLPEAKRALLPGSGGTQRLPRLIPFGMALEMLLTGDPISAQEAYRLGLVNKVVPLKDLMATAEDYARRIAENGPLSVKHAKMGAYRGRNMPLSEGMALEQYLFDLTAASEDAREGPPAFAERRKPEYKGR